VEEEGLLKAVTYLPSWQSSNISKVLKQVNKLGCTEKLLWNSATNILERKNSLPFKFILDPM